MNSDNDDNASWASSLGDVLDGDDSSDEDEQHGGGGALPPRRVDEKRHPPTSRLALAHPAENKKKTTTAAATTTTSSAVLDLAPVDEAFGPKSDLYRDVLGVKPNASPEQIQRSYFQRRNELFKLLSDLDADEARADDGGDDDDDANPAHPRTPSRSNGAAVTAAKRSNAERKMDGVVMAMRVLGDPALRGRYDDVRTDRLRGRNISPVRPQRLAGGVSSEYRAQETIHVETATTNNKNKKKATTNTATTTTATRKKPENESPPSPPQPPKKKQHQQQQRQRDEQAKTTTASPVAAKQPNKFYRRMVPVLDRSSRAAAATANPKIASSRVVSPEKDVDRQANGKKGAVASSLAASARWPQQHQQQKSTKAATTTAAKTNKERGIRFDMDRREYPAPKDDDYYDDTTADDTTADVNWTDEGTLLSEDPSEGTLTTAAAAAARMEEEKNKGFVARVSDELCGAIEDTAASFDQVFNVFTLQDEDIRAVRYRIDKFRQQVSHSL